MEYGKPARLSDGRYFLKITGSDGSRILKQLNSVEVQEENCYKVPDKTFENVDEEIINQADSCSEAWFGKKIDRSALKSAYDSSVSVGILEAQFAKKNGTIMTKVFDTEKNEISVDTLTPGTKCDIVVELVGIWFIKKSFGPIWRVVQARLKKEQKVEQNYLFNDDDQSNDDDYDV